MKAAGFLLLFAGWFLVLAALAMLPAAGAPRTAFVLAGLCVEVLGIVLVIRAHLIPARQRRVQ
jgi:hypothetical protein